MKAVNEVNLDIVDSEGKTRGVVSIALLPCAKSTKPEPLLDFRGDPERDRAQEPVQLLEGYEYHYVIRLQDLTPAVITTDREEVFAPDKSNGRTGRLRTGLYTGTLHATIRADGVPVGKVAFEVRSRKMDYMQHYRWMLRDIAEEFSEVIMKGFAPTEQRFQIDDTRDAATLYQRFAFLKSLITGDSFHSAINHILHNLHRAWVEAEELRRPGQNIPTSSRLLRQLNRPGQRVAWHSTAIESLPAHLSISRTVETLDTTPNRFVKFALVRWRDVVSGIQRVLRYHPDSISVRRGIQEAEEILEHLNSLLSQSLFSEVGLLTYFPAENQVLQKREGYHFILQTYVQFELAASLSWDGGEDVYGAGQRDVATLYEIWVFLQLARIVSNLTQKEFNLSKLLEVRKDGLNVGLRRGQQRVLSGSVTRLGRSLHLDLWYNRTFGVSDGGGESWTRTMRPDCSLRIRLKGYSGSYDDEIWIHFDAKYRVETITGVFGDSPEDTDEDGENEAERSRGPQRMDLLKMHAYRDAICRSSGAYVIYPGDEQAIRRRYHEILPGLGAFALRPSEIGSADGVGAIRQFITDVLDHVASQITQHERERFWVQEVYREYAPEKLVQAAPFLSRPPADTLVLLGFVRGKRHHDWIHKTLLYNLRGGNRTGSVGLGSRELAVDLVILYGPSLIEVEFWQVVGKPRLLSRDDLRQLNYPNPGGKLYYCLPIQRISKEEWPLGMSRNVIEEIRHKIAPRAYPGAPVTTTWQLIVSIAG